MGWKPTKEWIEKRNKKMDLLINQADEHRKEFVQSDDSIKDYLKFMRKFRHYSANNITMIQSQREGALAVAGYKQWQDKGLQVQKGEKAINILSPNISKYYLNEDEEVVYLHLRFLHFLYQCGTKKHTGYTLIYLHYERNRCQRSQERWPIW